MQPMNERMIYGTMLPLWRNLELKHDSMIKAELSKKTKGEAHVCSDFWPICALHILASMSDQARQANSQAGCGVQTMGIDLGN